MKTDIPKILGSAGNLAKDIRQAITGKLDPEKAAEFEYKMGELETKIEEARNKVKEKQVELNMVDAASTDKFQSRWRPAIGWSCALTIFMYYPLRVFIVFFLWLYWSWKKGSFVDFPFDVADVIFLTASMMGFAGYRTYEKKIGVHNKH